MKTTKTLAKACYDNYFNTLRCFNGGTREENERSADRCRAEIRKYVDEAAALLRNPSKLLRADEWLMRALSEDIPNNFAAFNRNYPEKRVLLVIDRNSDFRHLGGARVA